MIWWQWNREWHTKHNSYIDIFRRFQLPISGNLLHHNLMCQQTLRSLLVKKKHLDE